MKGRAQHASTLVGCSRASTISKCPRAQVELFKSFYVTAAAASAALSELSVDHSWLPDETKEIQRMDAEVASVLIEHSAA